MTLRHHIRDYSSSVLMIVLLCLVTPRSDLCLLWKREIHLGDIDPMYNILGQATHAPRQFTHISITTNTESNIKIDNDNKHRIKHQWQQTQNQTSRLSWGRSEKESCPVCEAPGMILTKVVDEVGIYLWEIYSSRWAPIPFSSWIDNSTIARSEHDTVRPFWGRWT